MGEFSRNTKTSISANEGCIEEYSQLPHIEKTEKVIR